MFNKSIIWIIPLKTLYNLNFECILWILEWFLLFASFLFLLCNFLSTAFQSTWISCYHFCCHVVSVLSFYWNDFFFHSRENCVISARKTGWRNLNFQQNNNKKKTFFSRKIFSSWNYFVSICRIWFHIFSDDFCHIFFRRHKSQSILQSNFWYQQLLDAVFVQFSLSPRIEITAHANRIVEIEEHFWHWHISENSPHIHSIPSCAHLLLLCCDGAMIQNFFPFVSILNSNCHNPLDFRLTRFIFSCAWCMRVKVSWVCDRDEKWKLAG